METISFDIRKAKIIEDAVCEEFGCSIAEILCFKNTFFKKVVVYLLVKVHGYNKRNIGLHYLITYLYVPTVVEELEWKYRNVVVFKKSISNLCKKIGYESDLDLGGKHNFN